MPSHKSQHFVPRCHLKPFSFQNEGAAINIYLTDAMRGVQNAPMKSQCAKDYFYGDDLKLEKLLQPLEGQYAGLVKRLETETYRLSDFDFWLLRYFILLQSLRTAEEIERVRSFLSDIIEFQEQSAKAHGEEWDDENNPTTKSAMMVVMRTFAEELQNRPLDDMKVVVIRNRTQHDFVTSDDPAIVTNRWLLQKHKIDCFGMNSAGLMMFMPLGPRTMALLYDSAVYSIPSTSSMIEIKRHDDVYAFNEHQYLGCGSSTYFANWAELQRIETEYGAVKSRRLQSSHTFNTAKFDRSEGEHDIYVSSSASEVAFANSAIFHSRRTFVNPSRWPSFIKFRHNAHGYTKGRVIVRKSVVESDLLNAGYYKIVG